MDPVTILFGVGVGILVGVSGMGGGTLMTPLLIVVLGVKPVTAVGTDIAYGAVSRTVGAWKHFKQGHVDLPLSTSMAIGSVPAAIVGVVVLQILKAHIGSETNDIVVATLSGVLILTGVITLARILFIRRLGARERQAAPTTRRTKRTAAAVGVAVGFMLGVTSAGSGALIGVALILVFRLVPRRVVGTDVFHASILLWAATIAHVIAGNVDFRLAGTLLIGSVPGVWVGSVLSARVPQDSLRLVLSVVLLGSGLGLLTKAGASIPAPVIAAVPAFVAIVIVRAVVSRRRRAAEAAQRGERPAPAPA